VTNVLDAEARAQEAEEIADDIEALENTKAPLWAVYGPGGTWDAERKALLCAGAIIVRHQAMVDGQKFSEAAIDHIAHQRQEYCDRITQATDERTQMALLDAQINKKVRLYELAQGRMNTARKLIRFDGNNGI
jgi:hypothetical protein